jgi:hypothetical protein
MVLAAVDTTVAVVAIAVSGGVALFSAVLAATTAHRRQARALHAQREELEDQLRAERERLDDQLKGEERRQRQRLDHELYSHHLLDQLQLIDEAATSMWAIVFLFRDPLRVIQERQGHRSLEETKEALVRATKILRTRTGALPLDAKLEVRFGPDADVLKEFRGFMRTAEQGTEVLGSTEEPESLVRAVDKVVEEAGQKFAAFRMAAREELGYTRPT